MVAIGAALVLACALTSDGKGPWYIFPSDSDGKMYQGPFPSPAVEVALQATAASPGADVMVPIELKPLAAVDVAAMELRVALPEDVAFVRAELSYVLEENRATIAAAPETADPRVVRITIASEKGSIAEGVTGYLVVRMPRGAGVGSREITFKEVTVRDAAGKPIAPVKTVAATLAITDPKTMPVIACFFYMH